MKHPVEKWAAKHGIALDWLWDGKETHVVTMRNCTLTLLGSACGYGTTEQAAIENLAKWVSDEELTLITDKGVYTYIVNMEEE